MTHSSPTSSSFSDEELEEDTDNTCGAEPRKHTCALCRKKFNRPSSLRIHMNTHTGVTPFKCPFPNCGRLFNVNSNMRRHYRNHRVPRARHTETAEHWYPKDEDYVV
ncbi:hypothetical protein CPB85DRAFT_1224700 [Mucidula mucida]|nr:hypothetical protein CPB85DRAFT_1224700 [Mucidula mucida]